MPSALPPRGYRMSARIRQLVPMQAGKQDEHVCSSLGSRVTCRGPGPDQSGEVRYVWKAARQASRSRELVVVVP